MFNWRFLCVLMVVRLRHCQGSSKCRVKNVEGGVGTEVCYHKRDVQSLSCRRDERLLILNVLHRMKDRCSGHEECCTPNYPDKLYDIGHCVNETETFRSVVREVLEECSQQRYCVLVNEPGSSIHDLKDIDVDDGNIAASLLTLHECIKDGDSTLSFCSNSSSRVSHSEPVYISSQGLSLAPSDVNSCRCNVNTRGNFYLTLLDVRLGRDPMNKLLLQNGASVKERHEFTGGRESLYFDHTVDVRDSTWTIDLSVKVSHPPHSVWIKVEGNQMSEIEVTCYAKQKAILQGNNFIKTENAARRMKPFEALFPYLMLPVGFVVGCAVLVMAIFIFLNIKREATPEIPYGSTSNSNYITPVSEAHGEHLYSLPEEPDNQGSDIVNEVEARGEHLYSLPEEPDNQRSDITDEVEARGEHLYSLPEEPDNQGSDIVNEVEARGEHLYSLPEEPGDQVSCST